MPPTYVDPTTGAPLERKGDALVDESRTLRVPVVNDIPRFVEIGDDYAGSFGWQWARWDVLGASTSARDHKRELIGARTRFTEADLDGASVLECGCARGDDTQVLLDFPLRSLHSFDLSRAVEVAAQHIDDPRVSFTQASIYEMPFADRSFDVVYCHRVLQHTPDPPGALRAIARKVRPGGILFAHSYRRSIRELSQYKYKYRPLTKRLSWERLADLLDRWGPALHRVNERTRESSRFTRFALLNLLPFERIDSYGDFDDEQRLELAKLVTFDALTPEYDRPMRGRTMASIVREEGLDVEFLVDERWKPLLLRARRRS